MGKIFVRAASGALFLGVATATAGELPTFEKSGFPITQVQVSVLGSAGVREQSAIPSLSLQGMPASPHQLGVLSYHRSAAAAEGGSRKVTAYRASNE